MHYRDMFQAMSNNDEPSGRIIGNAGLWRMVIAVAILATAGCFGGEGMPSSKPREESSAALPDALAGNPSALHQSFHAAYAEEMRSYPNKGDAAREIADNLDSIMVSVGDKRFAGALLRERPAVRSAVRDCMIEGDIQERDPLTYQVFQDAPQKEWPSDLAEEHATGTEGQAPAAPPAAEQ